MKTISIIGIIFSITGITVSIFNWILFTEQLPGNLTISYLENGKQLVEFQQLEHHEHSISMLAILILLFLFNLFVSIFNLITRINKKAN